MKKNDIKESDKLGIYMGEASISVSLTSFLTAVVVFFIGLLLTGDNEMQIRLRIPLVLLFLSAFGFLYSTLVYSNASGEVARLKKKEFGKQMSIGNILSEYFGVYCLVLSVPIVVLGYSPDKVLSVLVLVISILSFFAYHYLGYSILERYLPKKVWFYLYLFVLISVYGFSFFSFFYDWMFGYYLSAGCSIVLILFISIYSILKDEKVRNDERV